MSWRGFDVWKTSSVGSYGGVVDSSSLAFHRWRILFVLQFSGILYKWCTGLAAVRWPGLHRSSARLLCSVAYSIYQSVPSVFISFHRLYRHSISSIYCSVCCLYAVLIQRLQVEKRREKYKFTHFPIFMLFKKVTKKNN